MDLLTPLRRGWRYYLAVTAIGWGVGTLEAWLSAKASQADDLDERIAEAEAREAELTARIEAKLAELDKLTTAAARIDVDPLGRGGVPDPARCSVCGLVLPESMLGEHLGQHETIRIEDGLVAYVDGVADELDRRAAAEACEDGDVVAGTGG